MARESKFQNLTVDFRQLRTLNMNDRMDFLRSREGSSILPSFTPSQLNDLFPWFYRRSFTDIGQAFKVVSDRRNVMGGTSAERASFENSPTTGMSPRAARDAAAAGATPQAPAWQRAVREKYGVDVGAEDVADTASLIRRKEGYRSRPYWDVNAWRIGYGSDTITKADGSVIKVTPGMEITREDAERDLQRRIPEFQRQGIIQHVGQSSWDKLNSQTKAALTSLAYNYGSISRLDALKRAIAANDKNMIAQAIESYAGHNEGVNYSRRMEEARMVRNSSDATPEATAIPQLPQGLDPKLVEDYGRMSPGQQRNFHRALNKMGGDNVEAGVNVMNRIFQENPGRVQQSVQQSASPLPPGSSFERGTYNAGQIRNMPIKQELRNYLNYAAEKSGVYFETTSLGQPSGGSRRRGSHRHDIQEGTIGAADMRLYIKDQEGKKVYLDTRNENHRQYISDFTKHFASVAPGAGVGTGYMEGDPHRLFHFGGPNQPGGAPIAYSGPDWFKSSFNQGRESFGKEETKTTLAEYMARREAEIAEYQRRRERPSESPIAPALQVAGAPAGAPRQQSEQPQEVAQPSTDSLPSLRVMATGGHMRTDATQLQAYGLDKGKLQRENMLVTDGSKPLFTMNSEEEMKFNPNTGKVSVNPSAKGLKADPEALKETIQPPVDATRTTNTVREERATEAVMPQPTMVSSSPSATPTNSYDTILNKTIDKMSPSFERAIARSRFANTGDAALGGHFDFGASNMA